MSQKRNQSSLEYLMTYGWALVLVVIVLAVVFGNFNIFLPDKCVLAAAGLTCIDFEVETNKVVLVLQNNFNKTVIIEKIAVGKKEGGSCSNTSPAELNSNQTAVFTILDCNNGFVGEKFDGDINITYTNWSGLPYLVKGSILAKITTLTTISSSSTCQTAENDGLCNGLDLLFGTGYKAACCVEHGLCC